MPTTESKTQTEAWRTQDLLDLLMEALPCVEESEQFNKPACRTLSKRIRAALALANGGEAQ